MDTIRSFAVTWDYRCPFARNAHEHILDGLAAGAPWEVTFVPFFLNQSHIEDGDTPAWESPDHTPDLLSLEAGIVVRDQYPDQFLAAHRSLFVARHDEGGDLRKTEVVTHALDRAGVDAAAVLAEVESGRPRTIARAEHERVVDDLDVFGVPTFILGDDAVFARLMTRPGGNGDLARATIDNVLSQIVDRPEVNELKHTRVPR
jgi:hypothetical protein